MNIKKMRAKAGMTQKQFADYFFISKRNIENWESGSRSCPEYLKRLMQYKLEKEGLIKEEILNPDFDPQIDCAWEEWETTGNFEPAEIE